MSLPAVHAVLLHNILVIADFVRDGCNILLQLVLLVIQLLDLLLVLLDLVHVIFLLVRGLGLLLNALVIILPVLGLFIIEGLDHGVDTLDDLVEVAPGLQRGDHRGQRGAAGGLGLFGENGQCLSAHWGEGVGVHLHERSHGVGEQLAGILRVQDLDCLVDAVELLVPQPATLCPLVSLVGAGLVGILKELLVRGQLLHGVLPSFDAHAQGPGGVRVLSLLLGQHSPVLAQFLVLVVHELLEELLLAGLIHHVVLHVHSKGVIHVLEDPLHRGRLRGVLGQLGGVLHQRLHGLRILLAQAGRRHHPHHRGKHSHQIPLPRARPGKQPDSLLQRAHSLLHLPLLRLERGVLLLAKLLRLLLGRQDLLDVALQLADLIVEGLQLPLGFQDLVGQALDVGLAQVNAVHLALSCFLAPAGILVVDLLLLLAIGCHLGLHLPEQVHDLGHRVCGSRHPENKSQAAHGGA
mmetsp:Transcript_46845/g.114833  ORF Transcript_46845/g.114833 Transcript_46845/m.114833 type:complete len:464 (+) Transcript_46845:608-1999(+)